jgi:5-(aminomethyl)-3-furanmethanol phosphate kinase
MRDAADLTVVKLGGSYAFSLQLPAWLEALAACAGRVVIVPGGGPFADAVRAAQPKMGFSDAVAHRMGLMAMEQFGCAVASLGQGYVMAPSARAIDHAVRARQVPVWSPLPMALEAEDLPASWDVTADSLAAWLAARLGTRRVVFVKHIAPPMASLDALIAAGILDRFLPRLLGERALEAYIVGPGDHAETAAAIVAGRPVGRRLCARPHA